MAQTAKSGQVGCVPDRGVTSLANLVCWNVKRALKVNPSIDLKRVATEVQQRLADSVHDACCPDSRSPEERYLLCALLAWQETGHTNASSMLDFVAAQNKQDASPANTMDLGGPVRREPLGLSSFAGSVITLPAHITGRAEPRSGGHQASRNQPASKDKGQVSLPQHMCSSMCMKRLTELDKATENLRARAATLAHREAQRAELLQRAEAAWRDLENGYNRRLGFADEKLELTIKQIPKKLHEYKSYKEACTSLMRELKKRCEIVDKEREDLLAVEAAAAETACTSQTMFEESVKLRGKMNENQAKLAQEDKTLKSEEECLQRKCARLRAEAETTRALTEELDAATRSQLATLRDQIEAVTKALAAEEEAERTHRKELANLRKKSAAFREHMASCQQQCHEKTGALLEELHQRRAEALRLQQQLVECRCRLPVATAAEVRRTPSFAAECDCTQESKAETICSCKSRKVKVVLDLVSALFRGLHTQLPELAAQMPCELLRCMEDAHDWDRCPALCASLTNFFGSIMIDEIDVAVAAAVENYHVMWVSKTCADGSFRPSRTQFSAPSPAQVLHGHPRSGSTPSPRDTPPHVSSQYTSACYRHHAVYNCYTNTNPTTELLVNSLWQPTQSQFIQLKGDIEDIKKEAVKKTDIYLLQDCLAKLVLNSSKSDKIGTAETSKEPKARPIFIPDDDLKSRKVAVNRNKNSEAVSSSKKSHKQPINNNNVRISNKTDRPGQVYTVNMCFSTSNAVKKIPNQAGSPGCIKHIDNLKSGPKTHDCLDNKACFHNTPSQFSIDDLVKRLVGCTCDDKSFQTCIIKEVSEKLVGDECNINMPTLTPTLLKNKFDDIANSNPHNDSKHVILSNGIPEKLPPTIFLNNGSLNTTKTLVLSNSMIQTQPNIGPCYFSDSTKNYNNIPAVDITDQRNLQPQNNLLPNGTHVLNYSNSIFDKKPSVYQKQVESHIVSSNKHHELDNINSQNQNDISKNTKLNTSDNMTRKNLICSEQKDNIFQYNISFLGVSLANDSQITDISNQYNKVDIIDKNTDSYSTNSSRDESCKNCASNFRTIKKARSLKSSETENVKYLENSTFKSLNQHLEQKLNDFKDSTKCLNKIDFQDEESFIASLLTQIKNIVSQRTSNKTLCGTGLSSKNFYLDKVNTLLDNYLRRKIKRIHSTCVCEPFQREKILQVVFENVSALIDSDFQKLRKMYQNDNITNASTKVTNTQLPAVSNTAKNNIRNFLGTDIKNRTMFYNVSCERCTENENVFATLGSNFNNQINGNKNKTKSAINLNTHHSKYFNYVINPYRSENNLKSLTVGTGDSMLK